MKNITRFGVLDDPQTSLVIVDDSPNEKFGAYVLASVESRLFCLPFIWTTGVIQGLCIEQEHGMVSYIPSMKISRSNKSYQVSSKGAIKLSWESIFTLHTVPAPLHPRKEIARYRFAFQATFPTALHGNLHGQALCLLEYLELKEKGNIRTPSGQLLITCEKKNLEIIENISVLVCHSQKTNGSAIASCKTSSWGKTLFDRIHAVLCISENLEDRWRGYHWIPKSAIFKHKIIPMMGIFPGKQTFGLCTDTKESIRLWSDDYFIAFC